MFVPGRGRLLVEKVDTGPTTTRGGILLPGKRDETIKKGRVLAVGETEMSQFGFWLPMDFAVGQTIFYPAYVETGAEIDGLLVIRAADVIAREP